MDYKSSVQMYRSIDGYYSGGIVIISDIVILWRKKGMSKADAIELKGVVLEKLPGATFRVQLENGHEVIGHLNGRLRMNNIRIIPGDTVTIEMSPYDLKQGRISWRH